jgi:hypothetical protein
MKLKKISKRQQRKYFDKFTLKYLKDEQPEYIDIQLLSEDIGGTMRSKLDAPEKHYLRSLKVISWKYELKSWIIIFRITMIFT